MALEKIKTWYSGRILFFDKKIHITKLLVYFLQVSGKHIVGHLNMSVEAFNTLENIILPDKSILVRNAYKRYSDVISLKGLNMSVPVGAMYV